MSPRKFTIQGHCGEYETYEDYLASEEWQIRRKFAKRHAGERCQLCYSDGRLHVHHRTYVRIGQERPTDLTVLCDECHSWFHVPKKDRARFEIQILQDRVEQGAALDADRFFEYLAARSLRMDRERT